MSQIEPLYTTEYLACHDIFSDWTCDWVSQLLMVNNMLDYVSTQLVSLIYSTLLVPFLRLDIISFSLETWLNRVQLFITYYLLL